MSTRFLFGAAFVAASVPLLLGGCSGAASTIAPAAPSASATVRQAGGHHRSTLILTSSRARRSAAPTRSWIGSLKPNTPLLYLSDAYANDVNIYNASGSNQTPIGQISGLNEPQGLWVTVTQNLWVANTNTQTLLEYRRGNVVPFRTISDPNGYPAGVCGNNHKGLVYAVDILSSSNGNGNTINIYAKTDTTPSAVLTDANSEALYECVVDHHGNLFVTLSNLSGAGEVDEFPKGSTTPVVLISNLFYPIGITIDQYGALAVDDALANSAYNSVIYLYDPPYTYGPAYSFTTNGVIIQTALDHTRTHLWGADSANLVAQEWSYPHGAFENETSSQGLQYPDGVAVSPAARQ